MKLSAVLSIFFLATLIASGKSFEREPLVTPDESLILARAEAASRTSFQRAREIIIEELDEDSSAALDFALGVFFLEEGEPTEAESAFRSALKKFPGFARARANLALVLLRLDKTDEAIELLQVPVRRSDATRDQLMILGGALLLKGRAVPAEMAYRQVLLHDDEDMEAYHGLLQTLLEQRRYREGLDLVSLLLEDSPDLEEYWLISARLHLALEDPWAAVVDLECARRLEVAGAESQGMLGDIYRNLGLFEPAAECYLAAFDRASPSPARLLNAADVALQLADPVWTRRLLRRVLSLRLLESALDRSFHSSSRLYAQFCRFFKKPGLKMIDPLLEQDPLNGCLLLMAAELRRQRGELPEARLLFERASRCLPDPTAALIGLADLALVRGDFAEVISRLEEVEEGSAPSWLERVLQLVRELKRRQENNH